MEITVILKKLAYSRILPAVNIKGKRDLLEDKWLDKNPNLYDIENISQSEEGIDFSLIVPLYNSSKYIDDLLQTLINQKTEYRYEIILIDDGSKDDTLSKIREYQKNRSSLIKVISKKNGGISNARNSGLLVSRGKYVGFMDHDDMVDENYVQELISKAYSLSADLVKCEIIVKDSSGNICEDIQTRDEVITSKDTDKLMDYDGYIWACAISRKLFDHLRFPDSYWYEDMITRFLIYPRCNKIVNTTSTKYIKYEHENNASKTVWSSRNYKSLEQLYLLEHIIKSLSTFGIKKDEFIVKALLAEAGGTAEYRVDKLDGKIKKQVFAALSELVLTEVDESVLCKLSGEEKTVYAIFKHKRYLNWLLLKFV